MTEIARLRWEPGEDGILFGYSGTLKPWVFAICPPVSPGDFWMISTSFPLGQPCYVGSEKEARKAAERWLGEFTASLGAVFPAEPCDDLFSDDEDGEPLEVKYAVGRLVRYAHPGAGYPGEAEHAAAALVPGEIYTIGWADIGQSRTDLNLYLDGKSAGRFNSVFFELADDEAAPMAADSKE
jgi:hypothetical protein